MQNACKYQHSDDGTLLDISGDLLGLLHGCCTVPTASSQAFAPEPAGPSAPVVRVLGGGHLEGEDLPEGARRGIAVRPESAQAFLSSFGPKGSVSSCEDAYPGAR